MNAPASPDESHPDDGARRRRPRISGSPIAWIVVLAVALGALVVSAVDDTGPSTPDERIRSLAQSIKCPQCVGQSVADSDASAAQAIRTEIRERVRAGQSDDQVRSYFASRFGDDILLEPPRSGLSGLVWFLPVFGFVVAVGALALVFARWRGEIGAQATDADRRLVEDALAHRDPVSQDPHVPEPGSHDPHVPEPGSPEPGSPGRPVPDLPPDHLAETREHLLASIADLDAEYAAGDVDEHDYRTLRDDYTARAAATLRAGDPQTDPGAASPADTVGGRRRRRLPAWITAVVVMAVTAGAGWAVVSSAGARGSGELTGLDVSSASNRVGACIELEADDPEAALACFDEVVALAPTNATAYTYRGWLRVRRFDAADGLADLDEAIRLDPSRTDSYLFRAIARQRAGELVDAVADLAAFFRRDPPEVERELAEGRAAEIATEAREVCIAADTAGADPVVVLGCYRDVLTVLPGDPVTTAYEGWLLVRGDQLDRGLELLDEAIAAAPDLSAAYVFRAAAHLQAGDREAAEADLDTFDEFDDVPELQRAAADEVRARLEG